MREFVLGQVGIKWRQVHANDCHCQLLIFYNRMTVWVWNEAGSTFFLLTAVLLLSVDFEGNEVLVWSTWELWWVRNSLHLSKLLLVFTPEKRDGWEIWRQVKIGRQLLCRIFWWKRVWMTVVLWNSQTERRRLGNKTDVFGYSAVVHGSRKDSTKNNDRPLYVTLNCSLCSAVLFTVSVISARWYVVQATNKSGVQWPKWVAKNFLNRSHA